MRNVAKAYWTPGYYFASGAFQRCPLLDSVFLPPSVEVIDLTLSYYGWTKFHSNSLSRSWSDWTKTIAQSHFNRIIWTIACPAYGTINGSECRKRNTWMSRSVQFPSNSVCNRGDW
jgi:hypothetical protein